MGRGKIYSMTINDFELAQHVGQQLQHHKRTVATAESCTGGLIGHLLTEIAGSSAYYVGGIVAYSNAVKQSQLDVPQTIIESMGAVSEETARAMAEGVRTRLDADLGVATTGIAGPGGGTPTKPVGLVYIAVASAGGTQCQRHIFGGDRHSVKQQTAAAALQLLRDSLQ